MGLKDPAAAGNRSRWTKGEYLQKDASASIARLFQYTEYLLSDIAYLALSGFPLPFKGQEVFNSLCGCLSVFLLLD